MTSFYSTPGPAGTIQIGEVTKGAPQSEPVVTNSGTPEAAVLNFSIPQGESGIVSAAGNGTAAAPGIAFASETGLGVYRPGAGQLALSTNGSECLRITSAGNVGIGTTSPLAPLHIANVDADLMLRSSANTGNSRIYFGDLSSTDAGLISYAHTDNTLSFNVNGSEKARIDGSGRLLVGASSARANFSNATLAPQFQVEGVTTSFSSAALIANGGAATNNPYARLFLGRSRGSLGTNVVVIANDTLGAISYQGNDGTEFVEAASIEAFVDGTPGANDMPGRLVFSTTPDGSASPVERMRIKSSGIINFSNAPVYASNTAALAGGLVAGDVYRKSDGTLMITY